MAFQLVLDFEDKEKMIHSLFCEIIDETD